MAAPYRVAKAGLLVAAALIALVAGASSLLALFPGPSVLDDPLSLVAVAAIYACVAAVLQLPWSLPAFGAAAAVLFFVRRSWAKRLAVGYVAVHAALLSTVVVEASALFVFGYFRFAAPAAVAAFFVLRLRKGLGPWKRLFLALNLLVVLSAATFFANSAGFQSLPALAASLGAVRYFPESNNYDSVVTPDGRVVVSVGYGGGVYSVEGTDFPRSIRAADKSLARPEKLVLLGDRLLVTNNAAGKPDAPDAVLFDLPGLANRREIRLPRQNRIIDVGLDPATKRLLLLDEESPFLAVWDLENWRLAKEVRLDAGRFFNASEVTVDAAARRAYVCSWLQGRSLYVIDLDALELARTVPVGVSVSDVAVDVKQDALYLARPLRSRIDVLDRATLRREGYIPTVAGARKLLRVPDRDLLLVGSYFTGELEAIDLADPARRTRVQGFPRIRGLRYQAASGRAWIASMRGVFAVPADRLAPWIASR